MTDTSGLGALDGNFEAKLHRDYPPALFELQRRILFAQHDCFANAIRDPYSSTTISFGHSTTPIKTIALSGNEPQLNS